MGSDASPTIVVEPDPSAVATDDPSAVATDDPPAVATIELIFDPPISLPSGEEASRVNRRQHRPNNTDGRNTICRHDCNRVEGAFTEGGTGNLCSALLTRGESSVILPHGCREVEEAVRNEESIFAVYDHSAHAAGYLLDIRKLAATGGSRNACIDIADNAIEMHARIQQGCTTIANAMKRLRQDLKIAKKRQRTQELLNDWNEHEVYRLRCQVDTILGMQRGPRLHYDVAMNAYQEELDYSDAASSTAARPSDTREEDGNSSGGPPHCEVVGRSE